MAKSLVCTPGFKTAQSYRSITLKRKLQKKFGERISIINQTGGSAFICASFIPLGNALEKLRQLEAQSQSSIYNRDDHHYFSKVKR